MNPGSYASSAEAFEAMCSSGPLVLVLEDLQWSDVATIDLLSHLGQRPGTGEVARDRHLSTCGRSSVRITP